MYRIRTDMKASTKTDLSRLVVGRRRRFVVVGVWVLAAAALGPLAGRFEQAQQNDPATFLPGGAESVKVLEAAKGFPSGEQTPAVAVFRDPRGLGPRGRAAVEEARAEAPRRVDPRRLRRLTGCVVARRDRRGRRRADQGRRRFGPPRIGRRAGAHHGRGGAPARPRGEGDGARRVLRGRGEGLRGDQLDPPPRDGRARLRAARPHLPEPDLLDAAALHGAARRVGRARARNAPGRRRSGHQRADGGHPPRPRLRRGHRLRPAPDRPLPRGAPAPRGQVRRNARRAATGRTGHRRVGRDRDRCVALSLPRPSELDRRARPRRRDGSRGRRRRDADAPACAAPDRRPARVLAVHATRRPGAPPEHGRVGSARPDARTAPAARVDRHDPRPRRARARHPRPRRRSHDRELLPGIGGVGAGSAPALAGLSGGRERADRRPRHRPGKGRARPWRPRARARA